LFPFEKFMNREIYLGSFLKRVSTWCLLITVGISVLSFVGWATGSTLVTSLSPYYVPIAPSTAGCLFILSASCLGYFLHPENSAGRRIAVICASLTLLFCTVILIAFFSGTTVDAERLGFHLPVHPASFPIGLMSPLTATGFVAASAVVLLLVLPPGAGRSYKNAASFIAAVLILAACVMMFGYLYGTPFLYGGSVIPVALPTAAAFVFLGLGLLTACGPQTSPVKVFTGPTVRSRLLRAFVPTIIAFVLLHGLAYKTALTSASNPALISSAIAFLSALFIGIIVSKMANSIGAEIDLAHWERDKQLEALRESEEKFRSLAEQSLVGISIIQDGVFKYVNPKFAAMFGYTVEECLADMSYLHVASSESRKLVAERTAARIAGQNPAGIYEFRGVRKDGSLIDVEVYGTPVLYNQKPAAIGTLLDITHRKQVEAELKALAITDALTGLYNRRGFIALAEQQLKQAARKKSGLTLLFADLDDLKSINDVLGHKVGDEAIIEVAEVFREVFRKMDIIGRIGGDEFAILAIETPPEYAETIENRLQACLDLHNSGVNRTFSISLSIGLAYYDPETPSSLDDLISRADSMMYEEKKKKHL